MVPHPEVPSDKLKHNKKVLVFKKNDLGPLGRGLSPSCPSRRLRGPAAPRPGCSEARPLRGEAGSYWLLQPCEAEEPACFFLRLFRSRLLEVFRSLIFTWS